MWEKKCGLLCKLVLLMFLTISSVDQVAVNPTNHKHGKRRSPHYVSSNDGEQSCSRNTSVFSLPPNSRSDLCGGVIENWFRALGGVLNSSSCWIWAHVFLVLCGVAFPLLPFPSSWMEVFVIFLFALTLPCYLLPCCASICIWCFGVVNITSCSCSNHAATKKKQRSIALRERSNKDLRQPMEESTIMCVVFARYKCCFGMCWDVFLEKTHIFVKNDQHGT